jgi:GTPase SAR1 family protein
MTGLPRDPKVVEFDQYRTAHPMLRRAESELLAKIQEPGDSVIVLLAGPSGVGKTTLLKSVIRTLRERLTPHAKPGCDPVRSFTMPPFAPGGFSVKDLYVAILRALDEPGIEDKVEYEPAGTDQTWSVRRRTSTESALRDACIKALGEREVRVLVGDESQHLCEAGGPAHIRSLLESIKYLGLMTNVLIVLAGTYDLRALIGLNPQLDRRTGVVHFPRYRMDVPEERNAFVNVLRQFEAHLPGLPADLATHWAVLSTWSNGCVGYLKNRLMGSLNAALGEGRAISLDDLAPDNSEKRSLALHLNDILEGEADFSTEKIVDTTVPATGSPVGEAIEGMIGSAPAPGSPRSHRPFQTTHRSTTGRSKPSESGAA